jgi:hypothetical protein
VRQCGIDVDPQPLGRPPHQPHVADGVGGGGEQEESSLGRERLDTADELLLDQARQRALVGTPKAAGHVCCGRPAGQLEQGQRVAARLGDDAVAHPPVDWTGDNRFEECSGVALGQPPDGQLGKAGETLAG